MRMCAVEGNWIKISNNFSPKVIHSEGDGTGKSVKNLRRLINIRAAMNLFDRFNPFRLAILFKSPNKYERKQSISVR